MGARQTKNEISDFQSTPLGQSITMKFHVDNNLDPRSPAECRTPIFLKNTNESKILSTTVDMPERESNNENTLDVLRKRFFKGFTYNVNDPRSPNQHLNRTPLVFENSLEKSLSLDDTFADLFVESHLPNSSCKVELEKVTRDKCEQEFDVEMAEENESSKDPQTPIVLQQQIDPRSPSVGVERTPIIFSDDEGDETTEDIMLEGILATLSLNINNSSNSSVLSMTSENTKNDKEVVPVNKHLDRVRTGKKSSPKSKHFRSRLRPSQRIYEDQENSMKVIANVKVPQHNKSDSLNVKRTPLSCVRNRNGIHSRSRSVESSVKSIKTRLALTSYDDSLNNSENCKVLNSIIIPRSSQDSLES